VTAGIANFPPLLVHSGQVAITDADLDAAQKNRGLRGALGVDGSNLYLAVVSGASIMDAAYTLKALGATEALNLDGGGSSALYIGGAYKVGPGRSLPNAVIVTR
jgi:exopolysaccharide biosynthesis protein